MRPLPFMISLLMLALALSSCNPAASATNDPSAQSTSAAQTVQAILTSAATATPGTGAGPLTTQAASLTPTPAVACEDSARNTAWTRDNALYDVNVVDTPLAPEKPFLMSWTFQNTGSCTWDSAYRMAYESGSTLTESTSFPILEPGHTVSPGETVIVNIDMTAPGEPGDYQATWALRDKQGQDLMSFGVLTKVGKSSSQSPARPGDLAYTYECSSGAVRVSLSWTDVADNEDGYHIYRDGNQVADLASDSTSYSETAPGTGDYVYKVAAFNATGESPSEVSVKTVNCD